MKKIIIAILFIFSMGSTAFGWVDPWDKGTGFDDPWKKDDNNNKVQKPKTSEKEEKSPSATAPLGKAETLEIKDRDNLQKVLQGNQKAPDMLPGQNKNEETPSRNFIREIHDMETKAPEKNYLTPYGLEIGDAVDGARDFLLSYGLVSMGQCGQGELLVQDPVNICFGVVLSGNQKLSGASTYFSKECANNANYIMHQEFIQREESREYKEGWEVIKGRSQGITGCIDGKHVVHINNMPKFLGYIHENMTQEVVEAVIETLGGKKTRKFNNGSQFDILGSTVWHEYCLSNGKLLSLSLQVNQENPQMRRLLDDMAIKKEYIEFNEAILQTRKQNGKIIQMEYTFPANEKECGKRT